MTVRHATMYKLIEMSFDVLTLGPKKSLLGGAQIHPQKKTLSRTHAMAYLPTVDILNTFTRVGVMQSLAIKLL